ncbi:hypothetical protein ACIQGZ_04345 [Streptomyces sp. NPDC092296]|uniref:hypothetical protein n=1 Tax=Streptomyces sp. NPDC092296 TaxID=3366012 RepID=UPI00382DC291
MEEAADAPPKRYQPCGRCRRCRSGHPDPSEPRDCYADHLNATVTAALARIRRHPDGD